LGTAPLLIKVALPAEKVYPSHRLVGHGKYAKSFIFSAC
jgi:hypothetical protein